MKPADFADLMYDGPNARESHWVPFGNNRALCGVLNSGLSDAHTAWYGTGDMDEYDRAEGLPLCRECSEVAR